MVSAESGAVILSKRAKRIAASMAKADKSFVGKSASPDRYMPLATAIDDGIRPFEKQLKALIKSNQVKLDKMAAQTSMLTTPQRATDEQIAAHADALVKQRMASPNFTGLPSALAAILPGDINARMRADATVPVILGEIDQVLANQPEL